MAGHYFYDPRPFYGLNAHTELMPMEELFYGGKESVPYWMDQRMAPVRAVFDDKQLDSNSNSHGNNNSSAYKNSNSAYNNSKSTYNSNVYNNSNAYNNGNAYSNTNSNQKSITKRYNNDYSSSDTDDADDYSNNAAMVKKHGHIVDNHSYGDGESHSRWRKNNSSSRSLIDSSKMSSSHGSHGSHGTHSSVGKHSRGPASRIFKLLGFQSDSSSSSSDDNEDSYNSHSKKGSSKSTSMNQHGTSGSNFQAPPYGNSQPKQIQFCTQSVELQVPICCDNCERKVRACLEKMDGVESVLCDQWNRKVIVYGNVRAENVLQRVRRVKKLSYLWQNAKQQQPLQKQHHQLQQL